MAEFLQNLQGQPKSIRNVFLSNPRNCEDIDNDALAALVDPRSEVRALKEGTDDPLFVPEDNLFLFAQDRLARDALKGLSLARKVEPPRTFEAIQILNGHQYPMAHLRDDMGINV